MAVKEYKIEVFPRKESGKAEMRRMRKEGFIPGVYYSHDQEKPISFKVAVKEIYGAIHGEALVYHVSVGGERKNVLMKEIQYHPVTDDILHVDFMGVGMDEVVEVAIPIQFHGKPIGVKDEGGQLHQAELEIIIRCKVNAIPSHVDVDIAEMHMNDSIHASDLEIEGVEMVTPDNTVIASVHKPKGMLEEVEAEGEEEFLFDEEGEPIEGDQDAEDTEEK